ncbi:MAG: aldolase/citrate lyase family protein [Rhodocyclaceae bacterium]
MSTHQHPDTVLLTEGRQLPSLPVVDHYAGSEKLMHRAMAMQVEYSRDGIPAIDVTFDCEDGAAVGNESQHADLVASLLMSPENQFGRIGVRIHDVTHPCWLADLQHLIRKAGPRIAYVTLPKARGVDDVKLALQALRGCEAQHHIIRHNPRPIPLHVLIETHGSLRDVWAIAAQPGVESLDFGLMDFVSSHHGALDASTMTSPGQFDHPLLRRAKSDIVAAALAHAIVPTHNVTTELRDQARILQDAGRARQEFGFLRMWSIHPNQVEAILTAMRPDNGALQEATEILGAAQDADWGPTQREGQLHDRASYRYYWNLLKRAHAIGCDMPLAARKRFFELH